MAIDYSKFDKIEDSDEDCAGGSTGAIQANAAAPPHGHARGAPGQVRQRLEGSSEGLDNRLRILAPGASQGGGDPSELANELARFGLGGGYPSSQASPPQEAPMPGEPQRLCVKADGRKKVHTTSPDGSEMVEEFDDRTDVLLLRKTRRPTALGGEGEWIFEVGQPPETAFDPHTHVLRASASNPIFLRKDTPESFQWRIRNLPYPAAVYSVTVDHERQEIVVRTSNKKYFKRISLPDLVRVGLTLRDEPLTWKHQHNTLVISYTKPAEALAEEQKAVQLAEKTAVKM